MPERRTLAEGGDVAGVRLDDGSILSFEDCVARWKTPPPGAYVTTEILQWAHDRGREVGFEEGYAAAGRAVHDWNRDHGNAPAEAARA